MENCKEAATPIATGCYLDADDKGVNVEQTKYRGLTGSLLYLTARRPDIMFSVCLRARYQANPKESHFMAAKQILKYVKGTTEVGLWYASEVSFSLVGYFDFDFEVANQIGRSLVELVTCLGQV